MYFYFSYFQFQKLSYKEDYWIVLMQAGTWNALLQCYNASTWTKVFYSNKLQRKCKGLKITACMHSLDKKWTKRYKKTKKKPNWISVEKQGVRTGSKSRVLCMPPCTQHHQRSGGNTPEPSLQPSACTHPYCHPVQRTSSFPPLGTKLARETDLFSLPAAASGAPIKPCLDFLCGLWSISID